MSREQIANGVAVGLDENVHLGGDHYHRDRGGVPACPQLRWKVGATDVIPREEAERAGYEPCSRCCGGGR